MGQLEVHKAKKEKKKKRKKKDLERTKKSPPEILQPTRTKPKEHKPKTQKPLQKLVGRLQQQRHSSKPVTQKRFELQTLIGKSKVFEASRISDAFFEREVCRSAEEGEM